VSYLRNAWYAAGWSHEISQTLLARTIQEQPIVIYRTEAGAAVALYDRCPHRFAPLSRGKIRGDRLVCGYHGLEFDQSGRCVRNPHGNHAIPAALHVGGYPVTEKYGMVWVWMGEPAGAETTAIPSLPVFEDKQFVWVYGYIHVQGNYELVTDNLLDLTHVEFLHPLLASPGNADRTVFRAEQKGDQVSAFYDIKAEPIDPLSRMMWDGDDEVGDAHAYMHWQAPACLYLDTGMSPQGKDTRSGPQMPSVHLLTPESEDGTHYFWAQGRNRLVEDADISSMLAAGIKQSFEDEDVPMIQAVRSRMTSNDVLAQKPALLPTDEASVRARRILKRLIDAEQPETGDTARPSFARL
jgi:vanillate O-demethylase monooxygenase subunit